MLAQTVANKGSQATIGQRRRTGAEYFADVCMIAAAARGAYRYMDMAGVVVGQLLVKMVLVCQMSIHFLKFPLAKNRPPPPER
jgi:hypothetical protein